MHKGEIIFRPSAITHTIVDGLTIGQGCDGFSFWSPNVKQIREFFEKHVMGTNLFFHDDLWVSFFLASNRSFS